MNTHACLIWESQNDRIHSIKIIKSSLFGEEEPRADWSCKCRMWRAVARPKLTNRPLAVSVLLISLYPLLFSSYGRHESWPRQDSKQQERGSKARISTVSYSIPSYISTHSMIQRTHSPLAINQASLLLPTLNRLWISQLLCFSVHPCCKH
jgi:hypothetical protein